MKSVSIVGAGLAGCEAALQLASHGFDVTLYEAKPQNLLAAYRLRSYAELICNNSMGNISNSTPLGLLLQELKSLGSKLIMIAEKFRVNDPAFFAIDKKAFSQFVTSELSTHRVKIVNKCLSELPNDNNVIVATGPLTDEAIIINLSKKFSIEEYHFSDASSPVVDIRSVDLCSENIKKVTDDLYAISIPMSIFRLFCNELTRQSEQTILHDIDRHSNFEKCQSIENLAMTGMEELYTKRFKHDYFNTPCLLLRREYALENGFILVGCMTTLQHQAQLAVFSLIPSLEKCKLIKFGRMHRNTFINAPKVLNEFYQVNGSNTYIIGQLSGIDGYAPAIASGWVSAMRIIYGTAMPQLPLSTMIGGLAHYISSANVTDFQPMCASFAIVEPSENFAVASANGIKSIVNLISAK